jgi:hypothetical protein
VTDRWALADLRATAIMDATRTGAVAERNGRRLAEAASLSAAKTGLAVQAREPASPGAQEHDGQLAREHGSTSPDGLLCLEFTVPTAPRGWQEPNHIGYGRAVKPAGERAYQADIAKFARQARAAIGGMPLLRGGVRLAVIAYLAVPKSYGKAAGFARQGAAERVRALRDRGLVDIAGGAKGHTALCTLTDRGRRVATRLGVATAASLLLAAGCGGAEAHDFYTGLQRPDVGGSCCNGQDCHPTSMCVLPDGKEGIVAAWGCIGVPWDKVVGMSSPDGGAHICEMPDRRFVLCVVIGAGA